MWFKIDYVEIFKGIFINAFEFTFGILKLLLIFLWIAIKDYWQFWLVVILIFIILKYLEIRKINKKK